MRAVLVDGYNIIFKTEQLRKLADKNLMGARNEITKMAREYKRKKGGVDIIRVVFDGQDKYQNANFLQSPEQVFSRSGKGDSKLIEVAANLSGKYQIEVVSDDNFVKNNARSYNAKIITSTMFFALIKGKKNKRAKNDKNLSCRDRDSINIELKRVWDIE